MYGLIWGVWGRLGLNRDNWGFSIHLKVFGDILWYLVTFGVFGDISGIWGH